MGHHTKREHMRAYTWTQYLADLLSDHIPSCCLHFKRRKLYPEESKYILKMYRLDSTALLRKVFGNK